MKPPKTGILTLFVVSAMLMSAVAQAAVANTASHPALPYPNTATPTAVDRGALKTQSGATPLSVTVVLQLPKLKEAEALLISLHTPGNAQFHKFLTPAQFAARFAPTNAEVARITASLAKYGLTAERTSATTLKVTGLPANMERAFAVSLHSYEVPAHGNVAGYAFHAPLSRATIPSEISGSVAAVVGLDSRPSYRPNHRTAPLAMRRARTNAKAASGNPPGFLTVTDFANQYDVQPLYNSGVSVNGRTLAIVTLASFTPSDAFAYWSALGLTVDPGRLTIVDIDGGPGAPSDASGSLETTIDVEQSGGIAPGANVIVYQSPNTNQGFVDNFAAAIESNTADSISTSWGFWEWYQNLENSPVTDPITGQTVGITDAFHELFVQAAIQGQSLFAASGDGGAYDINRDFGCTPPGCSLTLSVDNPAGDTAITAGGGTTLPATLEFCLNAACTPPFFTVNITNERVWGWDYLEGLCTALGLDPISCGIFPAGSGGGVSIIFGKPAYQNLIAGTRHSPMGQNWEIGGQLVFALPGNFPGRNVPDISFNADPETGYIVYYTSSSSGFGLEPFWGGTSFVGPQLNGVTALLGESLHSRIGLLNFPLYDLAFSKQGYKGSSPSFHAIKDGDNWFYTGRNGYNLGAGLGTLDVANFAEALRGLF